MIALALPTIGDLSRRLDNHLKYLDDLQEKYDTLRRDHEILSAYAAETNKLLTDVMEANGLWSGR